MSTRMNVNRTLRSGSSQTVSSTSQEGPNQALKPKPQQSKAKKATHTVETESTDESAPPSPASQTSGCDGTAGEHSPKSSLEPFSLNLGDLENLVSQGSREPETTHRLSETQNATTSFGTDRNHTATVTASAQRNVGSDTRETPPTHMAEKESGIQNSEFHQTPDSCTGVGAGAGMTCTDTARPRPGAGPGECAEGKNDQEFDLTLDSTNSQNSAAAHTYASASADTHAHAHAHAHVLRHGHEEVDLRSTVTPSPSPAPSTGSIPLLFSLAANKGSAASITNVCLNTALSQNTLAAMGALSEEMDCGLFANGLRRASAEVGQTTSSLAPSSRALTLAPRSAPLQVRMQRMHAVNALEEAPAAGLNGSGPAITEPALPSTHTHSAVPPAVVTAAQTFEQSVLHLEWLEMKLQLTQFELSWKRQLELSLETVSELQTTAEQLKIHIAATVRANPLLVERPTGTSGDDYATEHLVLRPSEFTLSNAPAKGICLAAAVADGWHLAKTGRLLSDADIISVAFSLTMSVKAALEEWLARLVQTGSTRRVLVQLAKECSNTTADADSLLKAKKLHMFIELTTEIMKEQKTFTESCNDTATTPHTALSFEWVKQAHQRFEQNIELLKTGAGGVSYYLDADTEGVFFAAILGVRTEIYAAGREGTLRNAATLLKKGSLTVRIAVEKLHFRVVRLCADVTVRLTFPHRSLDQFDVPSAVEERVSDCAWGQEVIAREMASQVQQNNLAQVRNQPPPRTTSAALSSAAAGTGPAPRSTPHAQAKAAQAAGTSARASAPAPPTIATPAKDRREVGQRQAPSTPSVATATVTPTQPAPLANAQLVNALDSLTQRMNESAAISAAESVRVNQSTARLAAEIQALRSQLHAHPQTLQSAPASAAAATAQLPRFAAAAQHSYADSMRPVMGDSRAQMHHSRRQSYQSDDQQSFNSDFTESRRRRIQSVTAVFKMHRSSKHRLPDNEEQLKRALADALPDSRARFVRYLGNERHLALVRFESHDQAMGARNILEADQSMFELREDRGPNQP